jgi:serine/threonine-protein kinase
MGTAAYFSPEQAEGKTVDARSDIYSLGVVLYEMAVGRPPFTGDSPVAVASKHVRDQPALPRAANAACPAALEAVIMKAMAKDPASRYGSAEEMRADLLRFADGRPVEAGDPNLTGVMGAAAVGAAATTLLAPATGRTMAVPAGGVAAAAVIPPEDEARKRRTRNLIWLLVLLLLALGVIAYFLFSSLSAGSVTVPNVVGKTSTAATQTLQADHLAVGTTTFRTSNTAKGLVISTNPGAGTSVSRDSKVNLVISDGPNIPTVQVPNVVGKQLAPAEQALTAANLNYRVVFNNNSTQPVGTVLSQDPAGGSSVKANVRVVLTVSGNQVSVSVPDVIGQSPATAGSLLSQKGLNVGSQSSACSSQVGSGLVASQNPGPNVTVQPNTPVNLVISNGPCATVPNVIGQTASSAQNNITSAGLVANTTFDTGCANNAQPGNVDGQDPQGGAQVNNGSTVNISVCQSTTTTTTTGSTTTSTSSQGLGVTTTTNKSSQNAGTFRNNHSR